MLILYSTVLLSISMTNSAVTVNTYIIVLYEEVPLLVGLCLCFQRNYPIYYRGSPSVDTSGIAPLHVYHYWRMRMFSSLICTIDVNYVNYWPSLQRDVCRSGSSGVWIIGSYLTLYGLNHLPSVKKNIYEIKTGTIFWFYLIYLYIYFVYYK